MRRRNSYSSSHADSSALEPHALKVLRMLFPYLWQYKWRVVFALSCLLASKLANVSVPIVFKEMIDGFDGKAQVLALPILLLVLYGVLRFSTALFTELREFLFARVTQHAIRKIALQVFRHLHALSLRFHLERKTGGVSRDIERGTRSITNLISYSLYAILPTLVELSLVLAILFINYDIGFVFITAGSLLVYIVFTIKVSDRRIDIRREVNEIDSMANTLAIDSLINYETVKYFNNEEFEAHRYDSELAKWEIVATKSQTTLAGLNLGQQAIIAIGVTAMMWRAANGVVDGTMTIGDLVLVNAFLIQLYAPLNFLGVIYRELRQAFADIERMFSLLNEHRDISDSENAHELITGSPTVEFDQVEFSYGPDRSILHKISFTIEAGKTVAVVGPSGAGKSTLARLLFRFYDVSAGSIRIAGQDIREIKQASLRAAIGIVPQDTVLFNESIHYNIRYGCPDADDEAVENAAYTAQLRPLINELPEGFMTNVGERGLKLSGGEKQRIAIARALLKDPPIMIFDEATSALDSATEKAIQAQLEAAARWRTTLIIAHRLSTIMSADEILVLDHGRIIERGKHTDLLAMKGVYARMWAIQQQENQYA